MNIREKLKWDKESPMSVRDAAEKQSDVFVMCSFKATVEKQAEAADENTKSTSDTLF